MKAVVKRNQRVEALFRQVVEVGAEQRDGARGKQARSEKDEGDPHRAWSLAASRRATLQTERFRELGRRQGDH